MRSRICNWVTGCGWQEPRRAAGIRQPFPGLLSLCTVVAFLSASYSAAAQQYPPQPGTDRDTPEYRDATERYLQALDLDDSELTFDGLGGTTATNWSVKRNGNRVADLKCTERNTNHLGAVITYRLGQALDFNIYPVAVFVDVNRTINGKMVNEQCALKEWASVLTQYYWTRQTFTETDSEAKQRLAAALQCDQPKPLADDVFNYSARSAFGNPKPAGAGRVRYSGQTTLPDAARDFSNMMVVDALIGNEDRFPGGNIFFRSVTTRFIEKDGRYRFDDVRLYSLDNEAAFKGRGPLSTHAAKDLQAFLWRFDANMIAKLRVLVDDTAKLNSITEGDEKLSAFIREGAKLVLGQHAAAESRCTSDMAEF